jgi:hypothetical protein
MQPAAGRHGSCYSVTPAVCDSMTVSDGAIRPHVTKPLHAVTNLTAECSYSAVSPLTISRTPTTAAAAAAA